MAATRHRTAIDLERLTGTHERRVSAGEEPSLSLAVGAATAALSRSQHTAADLEVIISCSISKYHDGLVQRLEIGVVLVALDEGMVARRGNAA